MTPGQESVDRYLAAWGDHPWTAQEIGQVAERIQAAAYQAGWDAAKAEYVPVLMEHLRILADLRAKVEALPPLQMRRPDDMYAAYVQRADVLALLDGSSDG